MYEFTSNDEFYIGRGRVLGIAEKWAGTGKDYDPQITLRGQRVKIDGIEYDVKGVEAFCIMRSPDNPYRHTFCILVGDQ